MATVIIFATSFFILSILFLSKHREIGTGEKSWLGRFLSRFDPFCQNILSQTHYRLYQLLQSIKFIFLVHLPQSGRVRINKTKDSLLSRYNKEKDVIMGKKELSQNGSSSFFLRKINESKVKSDNDGERGKIEDEGIENL